MAGVNDFARGIDISTYQDSSTTPQRIDWAKPSTQGVGFVINRAVFSDIIDEDFLYNWQREKEEGYIRGAYGFWDYRSRNPGPEAQAAAFAAALGTDTGEFPYLWVDVERPNSSWPELPARASCLDQIRRYILTVEGLTHRTCGIYMSPSMIQYLISAGGIEVNLPDWMRMRPLWVAAWPLVPDGEEPEVYIARTNWKPNLHNQWDIWTLWQYATPARGLAMGMESKDIDVDFFNGTQADLEALSAGALTGETGMLEKNAKTLYIKSDYKVTDWNALAGSVDGVVFLRAAYVPLSPWHDAVSGKVLQYPNYDTAKTDDDLLHEDPDYRRNLAEAKMRNLRVVSVVEMNPAYDKDTSFKGTNQLAQIKRILTGLGDAKGDALCVQVVYYQWLENSKVTTIPDTNFLDCTQALVKGLYDTFHQTVYLWSRANVVKNQFKIGDSAYNYLLQFRTWLDVANKGEPTWPVGFTYLPALWKTQMDKACASLSAVAALIPPLTTSEADANLRIGSATGWAMKTGSGQPNHGFYGLVGTTLPFIKDAAGNPVWVEPIIIDCPKDEWFIWMGWNAAQPPIDTTAPSKPGNLTGMDGMGGVKLTWTASTDNVGVAGYRVYRNGQEIGNTAGALFLDPTPLVSGSYTYAVEAYDLAGNKARAEVVVAVSRQSSEPPDLKAVVESLARIEQALGELSTVVAAIRAHYR